jgi:hypothetical protein
LRLEEEARIAAEEAAKAETLRLEEEARIVAEEAAVVAEKLRLEEEARIAAEEAAAVAEKLRLEEEARIAAEDALAAEEEAANRLAALRLEALRAAAAETAESEAKLAAKQQEEEEKIERALIEQAGWYAEISDAPPTPAQTLEEEELRIEKELERDAEERWKREQDDVRKVPNQVPFPGPPPAPFPATAKPSTAQSLKPPPLLLKKPAKKVSLGTKKVPKKLPTIPKLPVKPLATKAVADDSDKAGFGDDDGWADEW